MLKGRREGGREGGTSEFTLKVLGSVFGCIAGTDNYQFSDFSSFSGKGGWTAFLGTVDPA